MHDRIWVAIHPRREWTGVLVTEGTGQTMLKAKLAPCPWHQRALPTLLEAWRLGTDSRSTLCSLRTLRTIRS